MLVLDMLVLDMLDSAMLESLPPTLPSATPLLTLPTELPTLPMLVCAPTIWELRSLARHIFLPEIYQSTWDCITRNRL